MSVNSFMPMFDLVTNISSSYFLRVHTDENKDL